MFFIHNGITPPAATGDESQAIGIIKGSETKAILARFRLGEVNTAIIILGP